MPVMRWRVVCALRLVMLTFWPTSALSSVDLPTLGLPTMAIRPQRWRPRGGAALQIQCRARRFVLACILRGGRRLVRTLRLVVQRGGEHGVEFCRGLR